MSGERNTRVVLSRRPINRAAVEDDFRIEQVDVPTPGPGQVLVRTRYLSLDPYMRTRIGAAATYAAHVEPGEVMTGEVVGEVVESRHDSVSAGDTVLARSGWQLFAAMPAAEVRVVDASAVPPSWYLGALGMPGMTAYVGLLDVGRPNAGDTVLVPAAAGAVGHVAGQLAKRLGCRVIGTAGTAEKANRVKRDLGFDDCIVHRGKSLESLTEALAATCPAGIDVFFDTVGGTVHDAAMANIALGARIVIVGAVARADRLETPDVGSRWTRQLLNRRARMEGFLVLDHEHRADDFRRTMSAWLKDGSIRCLEQVADGIESAPRAFVDMLAGGNVGKQLVRVT